MSGHQSLSLSARAQIVSAIFAAAAMALVPWIIFLGFSLPPKYHAEHWRFLWVGFDVGLLCVLLFAGWAAWTRRPVLAPACLVAGTLLLCDAWFDIVSSSGHRDEWLTLLTGLGVQIPLAIFFIWLYRQLIHAAVASIHQQTGDDQAACHPRERGEPG